MFLLPVLCMQAAETVSSPDGRLTFTFVQDGGLWYTIQRDGKEVIGRSRLGLSIDNHLFESALAVPNEEREYWGERWCENLRFTGVDRSSVDTSYSMPYGEWAQIPDHYNEMVLKFMKGQVADADAEGYVKSKCYFFNIRVRAYDEGIAFCYEMPETSNGLFINILDEQTTFQVKGRAEALCTSWAQGAYEWRNLSEAWNEQAERPLTVRLEDGSALSLVEAGLVDYCRTKFVLSGNNCIKAQPYDGCEVMTPFRTSWRLVMLADNMVDLCNHDYMVLNLNEAQAELNPQGSSCMTKGWSWIKPGKVFRSDLKKQSLIEAIDFAAARNFQYIHLDAGWYGPEVKMASSATSVAKDKDFTIKEIVEYGKQKNIGVFVYINQRALYKELDTVLDSLQAWGVKGVKFGFVQVGNQKWTSWLHEAVRKCADHHLLVDIHDEYRPTGYSRTYPNLMTAEGIRGNEEMPDATHNVTLPFTRFLCGPADYTLCYFNGRVKNTKAHQLAMAAVYYSPLTWMFWYDKPNMYKGEQELEFWEQIPTTWDDTKVLQGNPGEYIVTARKSGKRWFLGAMTNTESREVTVALNFLDANSRYIAHIYEDDATLNTRTKVRTSVREVSAKDVLVLPLLSSGGAAVWFEPVVLDNRPDIDVDKQLKYCDSQLKRALKMMPEDKTMMARNICNDEVGWNTRNAQPEEWCTGFWSGVLWMDYGITGNKQMRKWSEDYTAPIADVIECPVYDHDLGFITVNSYIKGYEQTQSEGYRKEILKAAEKLATLYNPTVGTILSWPRHVSDFCGHNTIMDNMINLELLYWAANNGGDESLADIATKHAETTMKNQFRPDGSSYHVAVYDLETGKKKHCQTHQGYADWSMWSRGQSWAIYGYTMAYRYTHKPEFLEFAQKVTDVYIKRLQQTSDDWVPMWDMDDPRGLNAPKDASTAAVVASALTELSKYVDAEKGKEYQQYAKNMLYDLSTSKYQSRKKNVAFLMHSTGNHPANSEIDASIIYADYYYIEALLRLKNKN